MTEFSFLGEASVKHYMSSCLSPISETRTWLLLESLISYQSVMQEWYKSLFLTCWPFWISWPFRQTQLTTVYSSYPLSCSLPIICGAEVSMLSVLLSDVKSSTFPWEAELHLCSAASGFTAFHCLLIKGGHPLHKIWPNISVTRSVVRQSDTILVRLVKLVCDCPVMLQDKQNVIITKWQGGYIKHWFWFDCYRVARL